MAPDQLPVQLHQTAPSASARPRRRRCPRNWSSRTPGRWRCAPGPASRARSTPGSRRPRASETHSSTIISGTPGACAASISATALTTKPPIASGTRAPRPSRCGAGSRRPAQPVSEHRTEHRDPGQRRVDAHGRQREVALAHQIGGQPGRVETLDHHQEEILHADRPELRSRAGSARTRRAGWMRRDLLAGRR